jgi:hypothetical protein
MEITQRPEYEAPTVTDLGTLEELTKGAMGGTMEQNEMKT